MTIPTKADPSRTSATYLSSNLSGKEEKPLSDFNPFIIEHLSRTVIKERSANGKLIIFDIQNGENETVATWTRVVEDELMHWPASRPCLLLHDLHKSGLLAFGTLMQGAFQEMFELRPDLRRYVAVVMPTGIAAEIAHLDTLVRELKAQIDYPVHWDVFTNRMDALVWLLNKGP